MLDHTLDAASSILYLRPKGALTKEDFEQLARVVDPHIEKTGDLAGLILEAVKFPGWDSLGALAAHLRFVREHHKHIKKLAIVTDSAIGTLGEKLASHFVAAQIKHFPAGQLEAAKRWVMAR